MTNEQLDALEAAAKAATPGPWEADSLNNVRNRDTTIVLTAVLPTHREPRPEDANYIAAANPAAVLELIAELRKARAERDWLARDIARSARKNWWDELTWKPEYWLERAAKEVTCTKN